jgi:uncharacterized membrane protein YphA (DoxX/SURF4 family)
MRIAVNGVRFFVGILFIISGLVKANDPLGLSYKMQEFFEVWNASLTSSGFFAKDALIQFFSFLHNYSLSLSLLMISLEVLAGIALLLGWKRRFVLNLLLLLMLFFTFLTAYAYWSGKFKNCGCFGDCLPITPLTSFIKDIVLLVMIIFLLIQQRYIEPLMRSTSNGIAMLLSSIGILFFQWYVLNYLPVVDCLPYKAGNNIVEKMKIPVNAVQDSFAMKFIYQKDGKQHEFDLEELPADLDQYTFVDRKQTLVRKGNAEPPIKGFSLTSLSGVDSTQGVLQSPKALMVLFEDFSKMTDKRLNEFIQVFNKAAGKGVPVYIVTPRPAEAAALFSKLNLTGIQIFSADNTAVKTAARTNPTAFLLENGTIKHKKSYRQFYQLPNFF